MLSTQIILFLWTDRDPNFFSSFLEKYKCFSYPLDGRKNYLNLQGYWKWRGYSPDESAGKMSTINSGGTVLAILHLSRWDGTSLSTKYCINILCEACWQYCTCPAGTGQVFPLHIRINILCAACWQYCTCPAGTGQVFPLHIRINILCAACWQYCTCPAGTGQVFHYIFVPLTSACSTCQREKV